MASRNPNILKLKKQMRMRRAHLNQFNRMHVPRSIGVSGIPEDGIALFQRKYDSWDDSPFMNAIFPGVKRESIERKYAISRSDEEKLLALVADQDVCDFLTMPCGKLLNFRMTYVFNRQKTRCYFLEVHTEEHGGYVMKSKVYGGEDRAMFDYNHKRISWHEHLSLDSLTLVLPRRVLPE